MDRIFKQIIILNFFFRFSRKYKTQLSELKKKDEKLLQAFHSNEKKLCQNTKEVRFMSDLIAMESKVNMATCFFNKLLIFSI